MGTTPCTTCGEHHPGCSSHTRNGPNAGRPCGKAPIAGAKVCASHGANGRTRAAAARALEEQAAARAVATLGLPVDISPTDALLEEVRWTAGHVQWLRGKVQELENGATASGYDAADQAAKGHPLVWGTTKEKTGGDDYGTTEEAAPSVWYVLYAKERAHLVAVCQAAIKAGVEERRVRLAEQQGDLVATVIGRILDALGLTSEQQALVPVVVPRELRAIAGGAA